METLPYPDNVKINDAGAGMGGFGHGEVFPRGGGGRGHGAGGNP